MKKLVPKKIYTTLMHSILMGALAHGFMGMSAKADMIDQQMLRESNTINSNTPSQLDRSTRLDTTTYSDKVFTYFYTIAVPSGRFTASKKSHFISFMRTDLVSRTCSMPETRLILDKKVALNFMHFASDGKLISDIIIKQKDCLQ